MFEIPSIHNAPLDTNILLPYFITSLVMYCYGTTTNKQKKSLPEQTNFIDLWKESSNNFSL